MCEEMQLELIRVRHSPILPPSDAVYIIPKKFPLRDGIDILVVHLAKP